MDINGTYRGFSPTDESGVGLGELEVVIDDEQVAYHFATGLKIESEEAPRSLLREMSSDEIAALFNEGADVAGVTGHKLGEDGPLFLFLPEQPGVPEAARVMVLRFVSEEIDGIFGPTFLFMPTQVEAGYFELAIKEIEDAQGDTGVVPRLANAGQRV